jgi:hypothetical protein
MYYTFEIERQVASERYKKSGKNEDFLYLLFMEFLCKPARELFDDENKRKGILWDDS